MTGPQRPLSTALAMTFALLALTARAWAGVGGPGVQVHGIDTSAYPNVRLTVVTPTSTAAPTVEESGTPVADLQALNLARDTRVVLAIDRSRSMAGASIVSAIDAASSFVAGKPSTDAISIVTFGHAANAVTGFSTSTIDAATALRSVTVDPTQGTALFDAVVLASKQLAKQQDGGRVLILLTDGQDISSHATLADAIARAQAAHVLVYPIAIAGPGYTPAPLRQLASSTGGEFVTARSADLQTVYGSIAAKLARTWQLEYATAARPGEHVPLLVSEPGQGEASAELTIPTSFGATPSASGPSLLPAAAYKSPAATFVVSLAAGVLVALALLALASARRASWVKTRLQPHLAQGNRRRRRRRDGEFGSAAAAVLRGTERAFGNLRQWQALRRLLERANLPLRPAELAWTMVGVGIVVGLLGAVASGSAVGVVVGMAVGAAIPWLVVWVKARRRVAAFENQLPDLLLTMAASLKAGHSFRQGIQTVVEEGQAPAADEFKRVLTDTQLGRPMEDSLLEMSQRIGSKNFDFVITAVTIQRQVGGSLAGLFDMVADTVRQRQQFARRIKSLTAMGRMSAYVLIGLPFFLALAMTALNSSYMKPLYDTSTGHMMIVLALVMMTIGSLILKKIVSFRG